ncbi:MAG TPA: hypothetical protein VEF04_11890 [Blastocatellia bacterium]|nr:hypothetical protein [Blastocatellia bacterium]
MLDIPPPPRPTKCLPHQDPGFSPSHQPSIFALKYGRVKYRVVKDGNDKFWLQRRDWFFWRDVYRSPYETHKQAAAQMLVLQFEDVKRLKSTERHPNG